MSYTVYLTETFQKVFVKKHKDKKQWLIDTIQELEQNPQAGKPLRGKLHGTWQLRIGPFRVWYEINETEKKVILKAVLHKDEATKFY